MYTSDALAYFDPDPDVAKKLIAETLKISVQAVNQWAEMVPPLSAARLAKRTRGRLKFDPDLYDSWNNRSQRAS